MTGGRCSVPLPWRKTANFIVKSFSVCKKKLLGRLRTLDLQNGKNLWHNGSKCKSEKWMFGYRKFQLHRTLGIPPSFTSLKRAWNAYVTVLTLGLLFQNPIGLMENEIKTVAKRKAIICTQADGVAPWRCEQWNKLTVWWRRSFVSHYSRRREYTGI